MINRDSLTVVLYHNDENTLVNLMTLNDGSFSVSDNVRRR